MQPFQAERQIRRHQAGCGIDIPMPLSGSPMRALTRIWTDC